MTRVRVLVCVAPRLLADAMARALGSGEGLDLTVANPVDPLEGSYDVALTSGPLPEGITAGLVLRLPDDQGSAGAGWLQGSDGRSVVIDLRGIDDVLDLVTRTVPEVLAGEPDTQY